MQTHLCDWDEILFNVNQSFIIKQNFIPMMTRNYR